MKAGVGFEWREMAYTEVGAKAANELLSAAGCAELLDIEGLAGGWANSNYLLSLTDGSRLVLKVWNERSVEDVRMLNSCIELIAQHGVPTPVPLIFKGGDSVMVVDGLAWMLLPFVDAPWLTGDLASMRHLGEIIARLHSVPDDGRFSEFYHMGTDIWPDLFERADTSGSWSPFLRLLEAEYARMAETIPADLPRGIIHGDLFQDNILADSGRVKAVLDFEDVCSNILANDLVVAFIGCGWDGDEPVEERWHALLGGYESVRVLSAEEHAAMPELYRYATLSVAAWRYRKFVMDLPSSEHAGRYKMMLDRLDIPLPFLSREVEE